MFQAIVAFDQNQLIGKNNQMPWHFPADLKYFQQVTAGHPMLMGRKTFESLLSYGGPLKGRHHFVLTRDTTYTYSHPDVTIIHEADSLIQRHKGTANSLFLIGGAMLYEQFLKDVDQLFITHIDAVYEGDTYFPAIPWSSFQLVSSKQVDLLSFNVYARLSK